AFTTIAGENTGKTAAFTTAYRMNALRNPLWIMGDSRILASGTFNAGVAQNIFSVEMTGFLIPRSSVVI
ncbi:MAG: hypothetical protein AAB538_00180, partial [Patescibacteria group bacterium]